MNHPHKCAFEMARLTRNTYNPREERAQNRALDRTRKGATKPKTDDAPRDEARKQAARKPLGSANGRMNSSMAAIDEQGEASSRSKQQQMPPPFRQPAPRAHANMQPPVPVTPAAGLARPGGSQQSVALTGISSGAALLAGIERSRSFQPPPSAASGKSVGSHRCTGMPTPATPAAGFNAFALQPGDPCWYISTTNTRTKAELLAADHAPIIGLEDLSMGLRSVHTQWTRLAPMLQPGDLCWQLAALGSKQRKLVVLRQAAMGAQVSRVDDEAAPTQRSAWSLLEALKEEEVSAAA